uniref:Uncharacterized protein n=1 Tax=Arion vulgaris TaxID=1028688 RepID=A0A0B6Z2L5_9EUPU
MLTSAATEAVSSSSWPDVSQDYIHFIVNQKPCRRLSEIYHDKYGVREQLYGTVL